MYRTKYPRPQFIRSDWQNLNGSWDFAFDDGHVGHQEKWMNGFKFNQKIEVPFCFQSDKSGINDPSFHDHLWYHRTFKINEAYKDKRVILHMGACDYESEIYINHQLVSKHIGGAIGYSVDITDQLTYEEEAIVVYAFDPSTDEFIPRGKQAWQEVNTAIWYKRTSGIWQTVWLEFVDAVHITDTRLTPNLDLGTLNLELSLSKYSTETEIEITILDHGERISRTRLDLHRPLQLELNVLQNKIFNSNIHHHGKVWSPENPYLFDIEFKVYNNGICCDEVKSYFGMRKIHQKDGVVYLNNRPYFQKLILDQGYFKDGLLTAVNDEDFIQDITLAKDMGFNGCRKHQVVAEPRFLYHADRLGFLVWGEMANGANFNNDYVERMTNEWMKVIKRDYNHPSIITWVPLNESWGVPEIASSKCQQDHSLSLYYLTKSLDPTRLVNSNDGWQYTKTDICGVHNYMHGHKDDLKQHQKYIDDLSTVEKITTAMPAGREIYVTDFKYSGEVIMLTEFGGISYILNKEQGWGYTSVNDEETFLSEYQRMIDAINHSSCIQGFCYTQLTDVFQEVNGLVTFDRKVKVDLEKIKAINNCIRR